MSALRIAVLASGRGSNLGAILEARRQRRLAAEIALVVSNVPGAGALGIASAAGVPTEVLDHRVFGSREEFDRALVTVLQRAEVGLVCLAGFMRLLTPVFLGAFPGRVMNIHPSLLPAFPGAHAVRDALAAGARFSGCTVHLVDEGVDTGPILVQAVVPVLPGDDEPTLAARILEKEHVLYPAAVDLMARGRVHVDGRRVFIEGMGPARGSLINPDIATHLPTYPP